MNKSENSKISEQKLSQRVWVFSYLNSSIIINSFCYGISKYQAWCYLTNSKLKLNKDKVKPHVGRPQSHIKYSPFAKFSNFIYKIHFRKLQFSKITASEIWPSLLLCSQNKRHYYYNGTFLSQKELNFHLNIYLN